MPTEVQCVGDIPDWGDDLTVIKCASCHENDIVRTATMHDRLDVCRECMPVVCHTEGNR